MIQSDHNSDTKKMWVLFESKFLSHENKKMKSQIKTINRTNIYWEKPVLEKV